MIKGQAIIFGVQAEKPIVNIPADSLGIRLVIKAGCAAVALVLFADRTEQWVIQPSDGQTLSCPTWKLGIQQPVSTPYLGKLLFEDISEGKEILKIRLTNDFRYFSAVLGCEAVIKSEFICDGESVPRRLHSIVSPFGVARKGAVAHDGLYTFGGYRKIDGTFVEVDKATADKVYRELTILNGLPAWRANVRYGTLRAFGFKAWNDHAKEREAAKSPATIMRPG